MEQHERITMPGKFDSPRDELLHHMTMEGWANESDGNVSAPTGWFARISVSADEHAEAAAAFEEESRNIGAPVPTGHFLFREDDQGFVSVTEYPTEAAVISEYRRLEIEYSNYADAFEA